MQAELQNGIITGYNITYQSLTENDSGFVTAGPNDRQANLTGLKEFVEYNISVVAFTVKGDGPPFVFIVRTDQDSKSYNPFFLFLLLLQSVSAFVYLFVIFWGLISIATLRLRCHDLIYRCLCANPTLFWNTINRMRSYMYFWALFLNKRAAASSIKGCAFAGIAIVQQQNRKKKKTM